jgi:ABC-type Fe3+-hydroxamate transport system substrate-binding protein
MRILFHRRVFNAGALCAILAFAAGAQTNGDSAKANAPLVVKDEAGRTVEIPQPVKRIISLAPSVTETIYALGLQDRLIADTDACNYPPAAQKLAKVGGPFTPNLEVIVALKPDLVVVAANSGNRKETADALDLLHVPTYATNANTVDAVLISIVRLGDALGAGEQSRVLSESLRTRLQNLHRRLEHTSANIFCGVARAVDVHRARHLYCGCDASRRRGICDSYKRRLPAGELGGNSSRTAGISGVRLVTSGGNNGDDGECAKSSGLA